jgi:hypothetical protein
MHQLHSARPSGFALFPADNGPIAHFVEHIAKANVHAMELPTGRRVGPGGDAET